MGNSQPKHAPKHKRRISKDEHHNLSDTYNIRRVSRIPRNYDVAERNASNNGNVGKTNAININNNNNNNNENVNNRDFMQGNSPRTTKGGRPMSLNTIPEDRLLAGEQRQQQQQQRSRSVSAGTSSFKEYQRQRKTSRDGRQNRSSLNDKSDLESPPGRDQSRLRSSSSSLDRCSPNISQRQRANSRNSETEEGVDDQVDKINQERTTSSPTTTRPRRARAASVSSRPTRKLSRNEEFEMPQGRARSKSLSVIKSKDRKISIGADGADKPKTVIRRPRSNSEVNEFRRRSLPAQIQKQLRKEILLSNRRLSLGNAIIPTSPKGGVNDHRQLKVPFHFPLNKKLMVKLIPPKDNFEGSSTNSTNGVLKHILFARIVNQDKKVISKTGQLYKATILFTEGRLKDVRNRQTGETTKRLVQAQIWSGVSRTVDFEDDAIQVTGNFMSRAKGMISFLEFELVLNPNFKNTRSEDTGCILFAVGSFTFKDTRSAVNKAIHWQAVVENWRKHGQENDEADDDLDDDLGWDIPCEEREDFDEYDEGDRDEEERYTEEEWTFLFMQ